MLEFISEIRFKGIKTLGMNVKKRTDIYSAGDPNPNRIRGFLGLPDPDR
jgi:hypothetical protein